MDLNWNDLKIVLAVARSRSFQGAGRLLRLSHTTVGRRIDALEHRLGRTLFLRQSRSCLPTAECMQLVAAAERTESELRRLGAEEKFAASAEVRTFRIISVPWVVNHVLLPRAATLHGRLPGLQIELDGTLSDEVRPSPVPAIALRFELDPDREETAVPVARIAYAVYGPAGWPQAEALPWVSFYGSAPLEWLLSKGVSRSEIALLVSDGAAVRDAVRAGLGRGLMPECLAIDDATLVRLSGPGPELVRLLRAVGTWQALLTPLGQVVIDWIVGCFREIEGRSGPHDDASPRFEGA